MTEPVGADESLLSTPCADGDVRQIVDIERGACRAVVGGTAAAYFDRVFSAAGVLVLPGTVLQRTQALAALAGGPLCLRFDADNGQAFHLGPDTIAVTYRATLVHADDSHDVHITSVYTRTCGTWRLALREQMPMPPFLA